MPAEVDAAVVAAERGDGAGRVRVADTPALAGGSVVALVGGPAGDVGALVTVARAASRLVEGLLRVPGDQGRQRLHLRRSIIHIHPLDQFL